MITQNNKNFSPVGYTKIVSRYLFPLHERLKKHNTVEILHNMESMQWNTTEQILAYQSQRLREFLLDISENVAYYKKLFAERNININDIGDYRDLVQIPFLSKEIIRANSDSLKSASASGLQRFNTGGSSGSPLVFFIGVDRISHDVAAKWRATRWWDVDIGDKEIVFWGSPIELGGQDRLKSVRDGLLRTKLLPAFEMSEKNMQGFVNTILSFKPKMLFGYPSSLALIARYAEDHNIAMDGIGIKVAFVTSERLYDNQRADIERVFGCRVANGYGGRDAGFIAHECPEGNMHITADDLIVEIIDEAGNPLPSGNAGEIVITHLSTKDYPFVRYRTGDIGILDDSRCRCGRGLPILKEIQGRTTDFIKAADGTIMHGLALIYVLRDITGIGEFKIIQETIDLTVVLIMVSDDFESGSIDDIRVGFKKRLGQQVKIDINIVDEIAREKSGKFRYVVSKIV